MHVSECITDHAGYFTLMFSQVHKISQDYNQVQHREVTAERAEGKDREHEVLYSKKKEMLVCSSKLPPSQHF